MNSPAGGRFAELKRRTAPTSTASADHSQLSQRLRNRRPCWLSDGRRTRTELVAATLNAAWHERLAAQSTESIGSSGAIALAESFNAAPKRELFERRSGARPTDDLPGGVPAPPPPQAPHYRQYDPKRPMGRPYPLRSRKRHSRGDTMSMIPGQDPIADNATGSQGNNRKGRE